MDELFTGLTDKALKKLPRNYIWRTKNGLKIVQENAAGGMENCRQQEIFESKQTCCHT